MLDWLIIGGGIHGTYLSFYLTRLKRVPKDRLRVLDPYAKPLARWDECTRSVGMEFLRSPHVQSLDHDPWSISTFAKTRAGQPLAQFIPTHNRPSLALFRAHCDWMIDRHDLESLRLVGRASGLEKQADGWRVETDGGTIDARNVLLAIGATEQARWTPWAQKLRETDAPIHHLYEPGFNREALPYAGHLLVVGGGISAAQLALSLAQSGARRVTLLMRQEPRVFPFDADLCWIGGDCGTNFATLSDYAARREIIQRARHSGSVPADVHDQLRAAVARGALELCIGEVAAAEGSGGQAISLRLQSGDTIHADRVILATGFDAARPGGRWLDYAIAAYDLPVAGCGYPIVNSTLAWAPGLLVTGPLAELEIGPVARNIIGARMAAELIGRAIS